MTNKFDVEYAKEPQFNEDGSSITLIVKFAGFDYEMPFTASPNDSEVHGRLLFQRASSKEFGEPATYVPYVEPEELKLEREAKEAAKQSGKDKLLALGLTIEEISALGIRS